MRRAESIGRSLRRFFCETLPESGEVEIGDQEAHHLLHVLRMKVGDKLELFDGRDCSAVGVVEELL
ncbi:MAG: RNA methyltransferase PUA domain-containing protein, partial [Planctomycetota bacterium]|nr:RNA methyltransferase PUA domain-containing protein [Planctomycetota bacterium]